MKKIKVATIECRNVVINDVEVVIKKEISTIKKPTIAILGGSLDIPKSINRNLLKALCTSIGEKLGKKKFNLLTTGSPGISAWVAKAASKNGATVWTLSATSNRSDETDFADVSLSANLDHEFISYLISYIADIGISIDGGIGSLIKAALMVDYEKPLICLKNTGGAAARLPELLRESVHNFQDLNLYEVETVNELMKVITRLTEGRILLQSKLQKILSQIE